MLLMMIKLKKSIQFLFSLLKDFLQGGSQISLISRVCTSLYYYLNQKHLGKRDYGLDLNCDFIIGQSDDSDQKSYKDRKFVEDALKAGPLKSSEMLLGQLEAEPELKDFDSTIIYEPEPDRVLGPNISSKKVKQPEPELMDEPLDPTGSVLPKKKDKKTTKGKSGGSKLLGGKISINEQVQKLEDFKKGSINVLVSTSVSEEGIDIPECDLVISFNLPQTLRSYVQLKGRARKQDSRYCIMTSLRKVITTDL